MIEDTLTYHLLKAMKRGRAVITPVLAEHGLHPGQELLLSQLWRQDGLSQADLGGRLRIEAPTVTKAVQRLERAGFVRREQAAGRRRLVFLTDAGRDLRGPLERAWRRADDVTAASLAEPDRRTLHDLLRRLVGS